MSLASAVGPDDSLLVRRAHAGKPDGRDPAEFIDMTEKQRNNARGLRAKLSRNPRMLI